MIRSPVVAYRQAFSNLPKPVWLIAVATLINQSGTMVLPFLALFLTERRGFSKTHIGIAIAIYGIGGILGSHVGGWLTDTFQRPRRVMEASLVLTGVGFIVMGQVESAWAIFALMAALSIVIKTFGPARSAALAAEVDSLNQSRASALNRLAENMGLTLGSLLGGLLATRDYSWLFRVDSASCVLAALFLWFAFRNQAQPLPMATEAKEGSPWRDTQFLFFLLLRFLLASVTVQLAITFPLTLRKIYGISELQFGAILAANTAIIVLFEMLLVDALRKKDPLRLVAVGSFLFCLGFGLLPFGSGLIYVAFTVMIWSFGEMLTLPALDSVVANRAGTTSRGRYMALSNSTFAMACMVAPFTGAWVYETFGPRVLWAGCISIGTLLLVGFWTLAQSDARSKRAVSA